MTDQIRQAIADEIRRNEFRASDFDHHLARKYGVSHWAVRTIRIHEKGEQNRAPFTSRELTDATRAVERYRAREGR